MRARERSRRSQNGGGGSSIVSYVASVWNIGIGSPSFDLHGTLEECGAHRVHIGHESRGYAVVDDPETSPRLASGH